MIASPLPMFLILLMGLPWGGTALAQVVPASVVSQSDSASLKEKERDPAQTFAVVNQIYQSDSKEPVAEHRLLIDGGVVYDFDLQDDSKIVFFDPASKSVSLINQQTQTQSLISTLELVEITAGSRSVATTPEQRERLGLNATVTQSENPDHVMVRFAGIQYDVTPQTPKHSWMALDFARFSDLASQLNLLRRQGLPPFARMTLGQYLAKQGKMPHRTHLTIDRNGKIEKFHSIATIGELSEKDRLAIEKVRGLMMLFQHVPLAQFQ